MPAKALSAFSASAPSATLPGHLRALVEQAQAEGYAALRLFVKIDPGRYGETGAARQAEGALSINRFLPGQAALVLCAYDRCQFSAEVLLNTLRTHPLAVVGDRVCDNFYYQPREGLAGLSPAEVVLEEHLHSLAQRQPADQTHAENEPAEALAPRLQLELQQLLAERTARLDQKRNALAQAEQSLQASEDRFRTAQDISLEAFTILRSVRDASGQIVDFVWTYANPAAGRILKQPPERLVGQRLLTVLPGNLENQALFDRYVRIVETGQGDEVELQYQAEGIDGWFRNMAVKLSDGVAISFSDITLQKQAEAALRLNQAELEGRVIEQTATLQAANAHLQQEIAERQRAEAEREALLRQVRRAHQELQALTAHLQTALEDERTAISREIHDEFGQRLTALKMDLAWLAARLAPAEPQVSAKISAMAGLLAETIQYVRQIASDLRPALLDDLGLSAALEWYAGEWSQRHGTPLALHLPKQPPALEHALSSALYRIFQEALTNIARHAQATQVDVLLISAADHILLQVRDNGHGHLPQEYRGSAALGLLGMRERAHQFGGELTVVGDPGRGTTVQVRLPRPGPAAEGKREA